MGIVNFGLPIDAAKQLAENFGLKTFVEGGTYRGDTAKTCSSIFERVITIEKSGTMFSIAKGNLKNFANVNILFGDTREFLSEILRENDNIMFWLDAHWSGGDTYGDFDQCPLIEELKIIFNSSKKSVILIDDARLFLSPPASPLIKEQWPSIREICDIVPEENSVYVFDDVIYIIPQNDKYSFGNFLQKSATEKWLRYKKIPGFLKRIFSKFGYIPNA